MAVRKATDGHMQQMRTSTPFLSAAAGASSAASRCSYSPPSSRRLLQQLDRSNRAAVAVKTKTEGFKGSLHCPVLGEDVRDNPRKLPVVGDLHQPPRDFRSQPLTLVSIRHHDRVLTIPRPVPAGGAACPGGLRG